VKTSPKIREYAKFLVPVAAAVANGIFISLGDDNLSATEAITMVISVLTALGVYAVPNARPEDRTESE
jgi:hypothetical protein